MPIIHLSDRQEVAIARTAAVLPLADRPAFYDAVARQLAGHEIGDGAVGRAIATAFQTFWKPPEVPHTPSRWQRGSPNFGKSSRRAY
jgi:hypothetical protein